MTAHRYWRINVTAGMGSSLSIGEIEMAATYDGADLCTGGTAMAGSTLGGGYVAASAFDDDPVTCWHAASGSPEWIGYDFGDGNDVEINRLRILPREGLVTQAPKTFTIQYSDDNSTWYDWWTETDITAWIDGVGLYFYKDSTSIPQGKGFSWRIKTSAVDGGNNFAAAEIELRDSVGGADATTTGGTVFSTTFFGGYGPENAFDDDPSTSFAAGAIAGPWIAYEFSAIKEIVEISIQARAGLPNQSPADFVVEYSIDNITWTEALSVTGSTGWTEAEIRTFSVTGSQSAGGTKQPVVFIAT